MPRQSKEELQDVIDDENIDTIDASADGNEDEIDEATGVADDFSRANLLSVAVQKMAGLKSDDLVAFFNDSISKIGSESDAIPDGTAEKNRASVATKKVVAEELATVFGSDKNLSEEFKTKMTTLFEAAVGSRVALIEAELQDAYAEALEEHIGEVTEELVEHVDGYLNELAATWLAENQVAVESTLVNELNESFLLGLKELFFEHYTSVPEEKADVVNVLSTRVEELEEQLNNVVSEKIELEEVLVEKAREDLIEEAAEGLSVAQIEKFRTLVEDIDYDGDTDKFTSKLSVIKEHHFSGQRRKTPTTQLIQEEVFVEDGQEVRKVNPQVASYYAAIARTV